MDISKYQTFDHSLRHGHPGNAPFERMVISSLWPQWWMEKTYGVDI